MSDDTPTTSLVWIIPLLVIVIGGIVIFSKQKVATAPTTNSTSGEETSNSEDLNLCTLIPKNTTMVYMRPTIESQKFGEITSQDEIAISGKTTDGWYGFNPGTAQAPNVGPFRNRYIAPDTQMTLSGDCANLSVISNLPPSTCFEMAQADVSIYKSPDKTSEIIATMHFNDYIPAVARSSKKDSAFLKVDGKDYGTLPKTVSGWVDSADINWNGSDCDSLPVVAK